MVENLETTEVRINRITRVRIRTCSGPYSVRMRGNTDQSNSEYGHFSRSVIFVKITNLANVLTNFIEVDALGTKVAFKVFMVIFERLWEMPPYIFTV